MRRKSWALRFTTISIILLYSMGAIADLNLANGSASGQWYNPARDGEGFYVEIIDTGGNLQISVAMYSYDEAGKQLWLIGNVPIADGDMGATVPVFLIEGPVWGTMYDPADRSSTDFGEIVVRFPTCDSALFNVTSNVQGLESGSYSLVRLTDLVSVDCVEPPPPGEPPSTEKEIIPGLWTGEGVCFFVNEDGTKIVENDQCDDGKALSAELPGIQVDLQGKVDPDPCQAIVACPGTWEIEDEFDEANQVTVTKVICVDQSGGIAQLSFYTDSAAAVYAFESEGGEGSLCYGPDVAATPSQ